MERSFWTTTEGDREDPIGARRRWIIALAVSAIIGFFMSGVWGPGTLLGSRTDGDPELVAKVHDHLRSGAGRDSLNVIEIDATGARHAGMGPETGHWEIGGITRTFTGHVLADAVERGEVSLDDAVARHLPELMGSPVGDVTLAELASHHSGLPRYLPSNARFIGIAALLDVDPLRRTTPERFLSGVRELELPARGQYAASDVGAVLLGQALASATGQPDWETLVRTRLFEPLGMTQTIIATDQNDIPENAVQGHDAGGRSVSPWHSQGWAPAGCCTWSTPEDMRRYASALLSGTVPGAAALDPVAETTPESRIGLLWQISPGPDDRTITWQRGETPGFDSMLLLDRDAHRAVIVLGNTATAVDGLGAGLIADDKTPMPLPSVLDLIAAAVLIGGVIWTIRRVRAAEWRSQILRAAIDFCAIVLLTARFGTWVAVPPWVHGLTLGLGVGALVIGLRRSQEMPTMSPRPKHDRVQIGISGAVLLLALVLIVV